MKNGMTNKTLTEQERIKLFGINPHGAIAIPDEYTSIEDFAFYCCDLKRVSIPNSVTSIGNGTFQGCISLTSITIPNSVKFIGHHTFCGCNNLDDITIPDSVTSIECGTFAGCVYLKTKEFNYKAFDIVDDKLKCLDYTYTPNKWSYKLDNIEMCKKGYHYCTNLFEVFDYYYGELDKDIAIYECEVGDEIIKEDCSSKCCTNRIKPLKRLFKDDVIRILNGEEE